MPPRRSRNPFRRRGLPKNHPFLGPTIVSDVREVNEAIDALLHAGELIDKVEEEERATARFLTRPDEDEERVEAEDRESAAYEAGKAVQAAINSIVNSALAV